MVLPSEHALQASVAPHVACNPGLVMQSVSGVHCEHPGVSLVWLHAPQEPAGVIGYEPTAVHVCWPETQQWVSAHVVH